MPVRESLAPVLRGEDAVDLSAEACARLEAMAAEALEDGLLARVRDECAARLRQPKPSPAVEYLLAAACALNGEIERAHQTLLGLGEKLVAARAWEPLASVAERALGLEETQAAAHLLVKAHEGLGQDPARIEALQRVWALMPDDLDLGLLLAVRLGDVGQGDQRRALLAELMPRFAAEKRYAGLEEAALEFVEHGDADGLVRLVQVLPDVAAAQALAECRQLLDIAFPPLAAKGRAGECHAALRAVVAAAIELGGPTAGEPFRAAVVESLRQGPVRDLPKAGPVLALSRIEDRLAPLMPALERFDAIAALPPGRGVYHTTFGAGRVASNDGENVILDFARSKGHRMPYAAARRTLSPLAEDDLRLLAFAAPAELERMRREAHGDVLVRALKALGGDADAGKLKLFLVGHNLVAAGEWTAFFRKLRAAAEKDARIDHARAFEQHYRLAPATIGIAAAETPLPPLQPRKPARTILTTLRKFLSQHPQDDVALAGRFGRFVERVVLDDEAELTDRARAGLYFARWFPERQAQWSHVLRNLWEKGLAISDLGGEEEQLALLAASHAAGVDSDAILSGLDSRFAVVRDAAILHRDRLDEGGRAALRRTLIDHAPRYAAAAVRMIEAEISQAEAPADAWWLLWASLALIEERPRVSLADRVLGWIAVGGPFDRRLAGIPCPDDLVLRVTVLLRQWRSSDRYLFPALEIAGRLGLSEAVATVRATRQQRTEKMFAQVGQQADVDLPVMTRATWERLKHELGRLERELRTTIPATIQKARELGDLRENAEYHSAKLKQANVSKQVASLQVRLARARFVDDAELEDGVVGLGTEVVLESERDLTTYWILGEGEHHHGENVVSFQAPVGRALVGKAIGDVVELGAGDERRLYRVVSVERKLPPQPASDATATS